MLRAGCRRPIHDHRHHHPLASGTTNLTQNITAGTYLGAQLCALCHSGGLVAANTYTRGRTRCTRKPSRRPSTA